MPSRYLATPATAIPTNQPSTGPAPMAPTTPLATASAAGVVSDSRDPGQCVDNPSPVATLQTAFANANVHIAQLHNHATTTMDAATNTTVPICLSYYLCSSCYANCQQASTPRALNTGKKQQMATFATQHLPPAWRALASTAPAAVPSTVSS
ncbi:hypothetical protein ACA910_016572 [Epithemia clementina (nom. ined.)]